MDKLKNYVMEAEQATVEMEELNNTVEQDEIVSDEKFTKQGKPQEIEETIPNEIENQAKSPTKELDENMKKVEKLFDSFVKHKEIIKIGNEFKYRSIDFSEQVDQVIKGIYNEQFDMYVSEAPLILRDIGCPNKPLLMLNSKIKKILYKHSEMSIDLIKQIPSAINDPLLVLKSKTHPIESVVVISQVNTAKGKMIIPIWINQEGTYIDVELSKPVYEITNFVASAYGRDLKELLKYALDNEGFFYVNKNKIKEVGELFSTHGLQLSAPLKISNFNIIISNSLENSNTFEKKVY